MRGILRDFAETGDAGHQYFQMLEKVDIDHRNRVIETALLTLKAASFYDQEYAVRRSDGSILWVRTLGRYLVDEENIPFKRLGTMEEISPPDLRH